VPMDRARERVCGTGLGVESEAAQAVESGPAFVGFSLQTPMHCLSSDFHLRTTFAQGSRLAGPGSLLFSRDGSPSYLYGSLSFYRRRRARWACAPATPPSSTLSFLSPA
jgi:hypothetical protein